MLSIDEHEYDNVMGTADISAQQHIRFNIEKIQPYFGAILHDVTVTQLNEQQLNVLEALLIQHKVLFIRGQRLSAAQQVQLAQHFGELHQHEVFDHHPEYTALVELEYDHTRRGHNDTWHADVSFIETPVKYGMLYAVDVPAIGGDTLWLDSEAAYQNLSLPIQELIKDLSAYHNFFDGIHPAYQTRTGAITDFSQRLKYISPVLHPVLRQHPVTNNSSIYVNRAFTRKIKQLSWLESDAILNLLLSHLEHPTFQLRWHWHVGDLVLWDNRSTQHLAVSDYFPAHRHVRRAAILGEKVL